MKEEIEEGHLENDDPRKEEANGGCGQTGPLQIFLDSISHELPPAFPVIRDNRSLATFFSIAG